MVGVPNTFSLPGAGQDSGYGAAIQQMLQNIWGSMGSENPGVPNVPNTLPLPGGGGQVVPGAKPFLPQGKIEGGDTRAQPSIPTREVPLRQGRDANEGAVPPDPVLPAGGPFQGQQLPPPPAGDAKSGSGILESLGLGGIAPYARAAGAGMAQAQDGASFLSNFARGFGGATSYNSKAEAAKADAAQAAAEIARRQANEDRDFSLAQKREQRMAEDSVYERARQQAEDARRAAEDASPEKAAQRVDAIVKMRLLELGDRPDPAADPEGAANYDKRRERIVQGELRKGGFGSGMGTERDPYRPGTKFGQEHWGLDVQAFLADPAHEGMIIMLPAKGTQKPTPHVVRNGLAYPVPKQQKAP